MRESLNAGIGVLVGVTAVVLACFATFIVKLARRSQLAEALEPANPSTILNHQSTTIH